ncbi:hypothetical protein [Microbacterium ureisolvens]|uniref:Glycosyltransferase n=1 Tax=Microbacterium ureisolvens TaxID=2781186 RepID=A0ABS7I7E3_9MICO|nr:hypothetical protein [Microbacterium ureisolvens]MBW9111733.1 hypothetical protein [Microbacterium ureisolvens]
MRITVINPLRGTMTHYSREIQQTLEAATGADRVHVVSLSEPSTGEVSRIRWVANYLGALGKYGRWSRSDRVIVTWPVLGLLDLILIRLLAGPRGVLIIHDGSPLVRSVGYGRVARRLIGIIRPRVAVVVHTEFARSHIQSAFVRQQARLALHPISIGEAIVADARSTVVRVLGQYKRDRDVDLLRDLGATGSFEIEVRGRGWPSIPGIDVEEGFLDERTLVDLLRSSSVVLIPYKRFYQSGIAIRAVEVGTPVVAASSEFMELLAPTRDWSPRDPSRVESWERAIRNAGLDAGAGTVEVRDHYFHRAVASWRKVLLEGGDDGNAASSS